MQCMKCGRETEDNHVFCGACLADMEKAPVKPGTPVIIPKRPKKKNAAPSVKKEKPEDVIGKLRFQIRILWILCMTLMLALCISIGLIVYHFQNTDHNALAIGSNYSTEAPDDAPHSR